MLLHEAPHKLRETIADLETTLGGDRKISLCRELTKLNEEVMRLTLSEAVAYYKEHEPRGEYVLVVEGKEYTDTISDFSNISAEKQVELYINEGMSKMDAIKKTAKERGVSKNDIYKLFNKD